MSSLQVQRRKKRVKNNQGWVNDEERYTLKAALSVLMGRGALNGHTDQAVLSSTKERCTGPCTQRLPASRGLHLRSTLRCSPQQSAGLLSMCWRPLGSTRGCEGTMVEYLPMYGRTAVRVVSMLE